MYANFDTSSDNIFTLKDLFTLDTIIKNHLNTLKDNKSVVGHRTHLCSCCYGDSSE